MPDFINAVRLPLIVLFLIFLHGEILEGTRRFERIIYIPQRNSAAVILRASRLCQKHRIIFFLIQPDILLTPFVSLASLFLISIL